MPDLFKIVVLSINFYYFCNMKPERKIYFYKDYFIEFYNTLSQGSKKKLDYVLAKLITEERLVAKFVKSIRDGIFELRVEHEGNIYLFSLYLMKEIS